MDKRVFREKFPGYAKPERVALEFALPALHWDRQRTDLTLSAFRWGCCARCMEPTVCEGSVTLNPCWRCISGGP